MHLTSIRTYDIQQNYFLNKNTLFRPISTLSRTLLNRIAWLYRICSILFIVG